MCTTLIYVNGILYAQTKAMCVWKTHVLLHPHKMAAVHPSHIAQSCFYAQLQSQN